MSSASKPLSLTLVQRKWTDKLFSTVDRDNCGTISQDAFIGLLRLVDPETDESEVQGFNAFVCASMNTVQVLTEPPAVTLDGLMQAVGTSVSTADNRSMEALLDEVAYCELFYSTIICSTIKRCHMQVKTLLLTMETPRSRNASVTRRGGRYAVHVYTSQQ